MSVARVEAAGQSPWVGRLARVGLVAMGVSYALVAVLAIELALGDGGAATDRQGALQAIASKPFGRWLIVLLAGGFAAYAIWRLVEAFLDREDEGADAKGLAKRLGYLGRAAIYAGLCWTAIQLLVDSRSSSGGNQKEETAHVLSWPAGRWIVGAIALGILAAAAWNLYRGLARKYRKQLELREMSEAEERATDAVAMVGLVARGVVFGLVGVFLLRAAWDYEASKAVGIDGALRKLAAAPYGPWLLGIVATGLLAFGLFCLVQAVYRKV